MSANKLTCITETLFQNFHIRFFSTDSGRKRLWKNRY